MIIMSWLISFRHRQHPQPVRQPGLAHPQPADRHRYCGRSAAGCRAFRNSTCRPSSSSSSSTSFSRSSSATPIPTCSSARRRAPNAWLRRSLHRRPGNCVRRLEPDAEQRAAARRRLDPDAAAMLDDDAPRDREPQPGALAACRPSYRPAGGTARTRPRGRPARCRGRCRRPRARDHSPPPPRGDRSTRAAVRRRELTGIAEQIDRAPAPAGRDRPARTRGSASMAARAQRGGRRTPAAWRQLDSRATAARSTGVSAGRQAAGGLDLGEIEQLVDEPRQPLGFGDHDAQEIEALAVRQVGVVAQDLGKRPDRGQRRAELVIDGGDEVVLQPVELLQPRSWPACSSAVACLQRLAIFLELAVGLDHPRGLVEDAHRPRRRRAAPPRPPRRPAPGPRRRRSRRRAGARRTARSRHPPARPSPDRGRARAQSAKAAAARSRPRKRATSDIEVGHQRRAPPDLGRLAGT